jgi:hypothetical protein
MEPSSIDLKLLKVDLLELLVETIAGGLSAEEATGLLHDRPTYRAYPHRQVLEQVQLMLDRFEQEKLADRRGGHGGNRYFMAWSAGRQSACDG